MTVSISCILFDVLLLVVRLSLDSSAHHMAVHCFMVDQCSVSSVNVPLADLDAEMVRPKFVSTLYLILVFCVLFLAHDKIS